MRRIHLSNWVSSAIRTAYPRPPIVPSAVAPLETAPQSATGYGILTILNVLSNFMVQVCLTTLSVARSVNV